MMKPHVSKADDGSTLFEWVADDCRFGISIESDIHESFWYFVTKDAHHFDSGYLPEELITLITIGDAKLNRTARMIQQMGVK